MNVPQEANIREVAVQHGKNSGARSMIQQYIQDEVAEFRELCELKQQARKFLPFPGSR